MLPAHRPLPLRELHALGPQWMSAELGVPYFNL